MPPIGPELGSAWQVLLKDVDLEGMRDKAALEAGAGWDR